mmetsp:Transcript_66736/g.157146  ORF Transcript_66736/g.157146 Transcript_66736/m.157146 type:complete len:360 (+) Transcript_66736:36-1115(+)
MAYNQYAYNERAPLQPGGGAPPQNGVCRMSSIQGGELPMGRRPSAMFGRTRSDAMNSLLVSEGPIGQSLTAPEEMDAQDEATEEPSEEPTEKPKFEARLVCGVFDERPFFPTVLLVTLLLGAWCMLTEQRALIREMCGGSWLFTNFFVVLYIVTLGCLLTCLLSDPGQMNKRKYTELQNAGLPLPKRAHKAWLYKRPILRFDHYCRWVTNVIGLNNHREFMVMCTGLATVAMLGVAVDAALLLWCLPQFRFPIFVILHLAYSAIFAKYIMPIFTIHVGFVSRSELAKDYKNDEFWVLIDQETGESTPAKDLDADVYNDAFDNDLLTYDGTRNPWDKGWFDNCMTFWCIPRWTPEQMGEF